MLPNHSCMDGYRFACVPIDRFHLLTERSHLASADYLLDDLSSRGGYRLLDHGVILGEAHLRRLLRKYVAYYNSERVPTAIGDAPEGRAVQEKPSDQAKVIGLPRV